MLDFPAWSAMPAGFEGRPVHEHNRLIASVCIDAAMRRKVAHAINDRLAQAAGPTVLLLPRHGIEGWDRPGEPLHDPQGLAAFVDEARRGVAPNVRLIELDAHINDALFSATALEVFDAWVAQGLVPRGAAA